MSGFLKQTLKKWVRNFLSTEEQIEWMFVHTDIPSDTIWSLFERLN